MAISWVFVAPLVGALVVYAAITLYRDPAKRHLVLSRLRLSSAKAPSSPYPSEKQIGSSNPSGAPTYATTCPPFRSKLATLPHNPHFIPLGKPYDQLRGDELTPTGFIVDEVRSLVGSMSDYAKLSGVPLPEPVWDGWTIENAKPRPYRPLRWKYAQTMSIMKLDPSYWLELESTYTRRIEQRQELYAKYGDHVLQCLPGAEASCTELMEHGVQFLTARYPQYFTLSSNKTSLYNSILGTTTNLTTTSPLFVLLNNVPEDFAIMHRNPTDGLYYFRAGIICSALGWSLGSKIGKKLSEIHAPIPDFKEKMQFSMDRYFSKMPTDAPIQRGSWGLENGEALFAAPDTPHGEAFEHERSFQSEDLRIDDVTFRVDWQTLRRLPVTGTIIFNFKGLFTLLPEFRHEPYVPALLEKVLKEGKKEIMVYKGTWAVEHVVLPELRKWVAEQKERGLTEKDWDVETLSESPWFPGWVESWQKSMGLSGEGDGKTGLGRER